MSTRATIQVSDIDGEHTLYRHHDGYPDTEHGVLATLRQALPFAWPLPRFEADEFAAAIVAAWKSNTGPGGIRLVLDHDSIGGAEFQYNITLEDDGLIATVRDVYGGDTERHVIVPVADFPGN